MRRITKEALGIKPLRQLAAQRAKKVNAEKRLAICHTWETQIASGEIDPMAIYWGDRKSPRLGACPGNNQYLAIWMKKELKKAAPHSDLILRGRGRRKGGRFVVISMRLTFRG